MFVVVFILKLLLYLFLAFISFVLLILLLPVTYSGEVLFAGGVAANYRFGWPWKIFNVKGSYNEDKLEMGLYLANLRILKLNLDKMENQFKDKKVNKEDKPKNESKKEKKEAKNLGDFFDTGLLKEFLAYAKRILKILKPKYMHLKGTYGFEDPALTGMVCGAVNVVNAVVPNAKIDLYPDFTDEVLEIDFKAEGRVVAGRLLFQTLRTFLKKDIRKKIFKK